MSPDIEAVHRLLLDQKASSKKLFSARAPRGMSLNVLIFSTQVWNVAKPYIEKYQTEYIPESRPVSPTAFSLDSPASPRKRVRHEWKHTPNKFFFFFLAITSVTKKQRSYTVILVNTTVSQKCVAIIWDQLEQNGRNGSLRFTVTLHW